MRKIAVVLVLLTGFGGLLGVGAVTGLLAGMGGGERTSGARCGAALGASAAADSRGRRMAQGLGSEQRRVVQRIIEVGKRRELSPRAWQIAIQAGKTESNLRNLNYGHADSLGVFQMRPSMNWGTPQQVTNLDYSINKFYDELLEVDGWKDMRPGTAAQSVERSAFPTRYHEVESMAAYLVGDESGTRTSNDCSGSPNTGELTAKVVDYARKQLGSPYVWGAEGPNRFDCSGLTQRAWAAAGVEIPRVSQDQYHSGGAMVPLSKARSGDLVFWGHGRDSNSVHHVALYIGDNKVLHAPQPGEKVEITELWDGGELLPTVVRPSRARAS
ncbi:MULTISPECIES: C40 family peptidase [unclassified Actinopolyspora]|uniref:C40 family peptidase n=1 Tax=unclassified Actinopolyspora TaxID=2639451 RepID=UPI0013F64C06|nr:MULTISPECIES: C40 family peptidase [unclassified Actinopolyspora]NHD18583.1 C40 family peptidase [Actinopolyspora sp. BKK2]NHE77458.1 C40 family peptidase [Actinopolyspora sp. BKK1]